MDKGTKVSGEEDWKHKAGLVVETRVATETVGLQLSNTLKRNYGKVD